MKTDKTDTPAKATPSKKKARTTPPRKVRLRQLRIEDYEAVRDLQLRCFPGMKPWTREQFESQIKHFPEGQLCVTTGDRIIASSSSLIVDFDLHSDWANWAAISDNGYIRNHNPNGDTLYGIEIMVDPEFRGYRLSRRLYEARKQLARDRNLMRIMIGGRIPGYGRRADKMSARVYVEKVMSKEIHDPVLTAQVANGFSLKGLIPDYLPSDTESRGYATFLEWTNLEYRPDDKRQLRPVQMVRLGVVQYEMRTISSFEEFVRQCEYFVDIVADHRADFILFPELLTTQLLSFTPAARPGLAARKLAEFTPRYIEMFTDLAIKYNVNIVGGSQFSIEDDRLYNISYLFRRDGTVGKQYKLHITPSERRWWGVSPGNKLEVFETDRGRIAILVCYDIEFPELCRVAARRGAQIFFVPFNTDERHGYLRVRHCALARCVENHVYVAIAGATGNLPFVENADVHYAQSGIFTPCDVSFSRDGVAAECTANVETIVLHDVDIEALRMHRYAGTTLNWSDRRKDLYSVRYIQADETEDI